MTVPFKPVEAGSVRPGPAGEGSSTEKTSDGRPAAAAPERSGSLVLPLDVFIASLPPAGRLMALDVGTKTIGIAISDTTRMVASGLETLQRTKFGGDATLLIARAATHGVVGVVIGLPVNLDGTNGPRVQATRAFAANLGARLPLPTLLWDERLSTVAAERSLLEADASRSRRKAVIDKVAAVIILQGALERMREYARAHQPASAAAVG